MAGATIHVDLRAEQLRTALAQLRRMGQDPGRLLRPIGVLLVRNTQDRFDAETDPDGNRWAPLSPWYAAVKTGPGILRGAGMRGGLQGSIVSEVSGSELAIGSNKVYAAIHQFGGTIKPSKGKLLVFRTAGGQVFGAARSVTIPARPYLGLSSDDARDILEVVEVQVARLIDGASRARG